jgi:hypothetical protein
MPVFRTVRRFDAPWLAELAAAVEDTRGFRFEAHGASLRIRPVRVTHVASVGDAVALELDPHEPGKWEWWGDFESTLEVRRRRRFGGEWADLFSVEEVSSWVDGELDSYLARLG